MNAAFVSTQLEWRTIFYAIERGFETNFFRLISSIRRTFISAATGDIDEFLIFFDEDAY